MAKSEDKPKIEKPVKVENVPLAMVGKQLIVPPGYAFVVPIIDGHEVESEGFMYPSNKVERFYGNTQKFTIKKKNK